MINWDRTADDWHEYLDLDKPEDIGEDMPLPEDGVKTVADIMFEDRILALETRVNILQEQMSGLIVGSDTPITLHHPDPRDFNDDDEGYARAALIPKSKTYKILDDWIETFLQEEPGENNED